MTDIVTSLHGREIGLDATGRLVVRGGIVGLGATANGFGAKGDGTTNDAAALNAGIAAVAAAGGGTLRLEAGVTYAITSRLDMASNVRVVGDDTVIEHNGQPFRANALTGGGFEGITFRQMGVTGQGLVQGCTGFTIDHCRFEDQVSSVAITTTSNKCRVAFCEFIDGGSTALELNGTGVANNDILFNHFEDNVGFGVWVTGGANNNLIEGNRTPDNGLELIGITYDSFSNRLVGNYAEGTGDNGISVTGQFNVLVGNVTRGNAFHGLCLYGARNVVSGHISTNNGTAGAGYAGIAFSGAFGGTGCFNSVSGGVCDDTQSSPTQAHCWKVNAAAYTAHANGQSVSIGAYRTAANKLYRATTAGTTGVTPLTHTSGTASDGAVTWQFLDVFGNDSEEPGGNSIVGVVLGRFLTSQTLDSTAEKRLELEGRDHPGYLASRQYTLWGGATQNNALGAIDTIYFYPFYVPKRLVFSSGAVRGATGGAGSSVKVGIWANSTVSGRPLGAPLAVDNTGASTTGTGQIAIAISGSLEAGWYWIGTKTTGTPPSLVSTNGVLGWAMPQGGAVSATQISFADTYSNSMPTLAEGASFTSVTSGGAPVLSVLT